ncbi:hypothetical protein [Clostridium merdae]|uniref:hypothetical protein n=1 Tax=Clostridium merdae TaxID=1958780 RepID=UPI000A267383|nr:hypothetical protein [Clostridium merdae]
MLFSINDASIFPEKDKIAKVAKEKFGNHQYLSKAVSVEDEIETYFNRISYELKLINSVKKNGYKKETLRLLRKEQADITNYFKSLVETPLFKDVDEAMLVKKIEDYFKILSINYREA